MGKEYSISEEQLVFQFKEKNFKKLYASNENDIIKKDELMMKLFGQKRYKCHFCFKELEEYYEWIIYLPSFTLDAVGIIRRQLWKLYVELLNPTEEELKKLNLAPTCYNIDSNDNIWYKEQFTAAVIVYNNIDNVCYTETYAPIEE